MKKLYPFVSTEYCLIYSIGGMFTTFKLSWLGFSGHRYTKQISQYNQRHMRHAVILADMKQILVWSCFASSKFCLVYGEGKLKDKCVKKQT